jgi:DNA helicase MCM8
VAYARQYVHPVLSPAAAAVVKACYLALRRAAAADPSAPPVTHRQLESLVRLSEARARVDLREEVSAEDAEDAVAVMLESLAGAGAEGPSTLDFGGGGGGGGGPGGGGARRGGAAAERRRFVEALRRECRARGDADVEAGALFDLADRLELGCDVPALMEALNEAGDLLKRGPGKWRVAGAGVARAAAAGAAPPSQPGRQGGGRGAGDW